MRRRAGGFEIHSRDPLYGLSTLQWGQLSEFSSSKSWAPNSVMGDARHVRAVPDAEVYVTDVDGVPDVCEPHSLAVLEGDGGKAGDVTGTVGGTGGR